MSEVLDEHTENELVNNSRPASAIKLSPEAQDKLYRFFSDLKKIDDFLQVLSNVLPECLMKTVTNSENTVFNIQNMCNLNRLTFFDFEIKKLVTTEDPASTKHEIVMCFTVMSYKNQIISSTLADKNSMEYIEAVNGVLDKTLNNIEQLYEEEIENGKNDSHTEGNHDHKAIPEK